MNKFRLVVRCQVLVVLAFLGVLGIAIVHAGPGDQIKRRPFPVSTFFPLTDDHPSVAMNTDGDFVVVWASISGLSIEPGEGIWGRRFGRDGAPQGDQFRVSPPRVSLPRDEAPVIAMDADGNFVVAWFQDNFGFSAHAILGQRFNAVGVPQGAMFTVNPPSHPPSNISVPAIAMDADGDFIIVWSAPDPDNDHISSFGRRYSASGVPQGPEFRVNQPTPATFFTFPTVAMTASGDFVVTWLQGLEDTPSTIQGRLFNTDGIAQGDEFTVLGSGPGLVEGPMVVAMDAAGNFVVAFGRFVTGGPFGSESVGIFARRFNTLGVPQGTEFKVSQGGRVQSRGDISTDMDTNGDFVVAWISNEFVEFPPPGGGTFLHTRLFNASGVPVTDDRRFNFRELIGGPRQSTVAMDGQGNFTIAWQQGGNNSDGSGISDNIFAQRFAGPEDTRRACVHIIATHVGTGGANVILGTAGEDVIQGLGGNDVINGRGGNDIICGGSGDDQLFGEAGNDWLLGGPGNDALDGGANRDRCDGQVHTTQDTAVACEKIVRVP